MMIRLKTFAMIATITFFSLLVAGLVRSCSGRDTGDQLSEMKADLVAINGKLGVPPLEPMAVFAKKGSSNVEFRYKPSDQESFARTVTAAAIDVGYYVPSPSTAPWHSASIVLLCKSGNRVLNVVPMGSDVVSVALHMTAPPLVGNDPCKQ